METIRHDSAANVMTTALEELVTCDCGHAIGAHDSMGCRALRPRRCDCSRDRGWVLDVAVARSVSSVSSSSAAGKADARRVEPWQTHQTDQSSFKAAARAAEPEPPA